ncbi:hypothetical protein E6O75_ATG05708 [Venturia nashicola]|uniref:Uncharacterized protein n=1 Tax=Venturia nashicola TaxID=86259 RepID=A0A4Z1NXW7_9PEZI|nr:hypothetical protein E6O75_ATG05708 [Venturia nashicola]
MIEWPEYPRCDQSKVLERALPAGADTDNQQMNGAAEKRLGIQPSSIIIRLSKGVVCSLQAQRLSAGADIRAGTRTNEAPKAEVEGHSILSRVEYHVEIAWEDWKDYLCSVVPRRGGHRCLKASAGTFYLLPTSSHNGRSIVPISCVNLLNSYAMDLSV